MRKAKTFLKLSLVLIAILLLAEIMARLVLAPIAQESMQYYTEHGIRFKPSSLGRRSWNPINGLATTVRINSLGLRGAELKDEKTVRILFLGDSITIQDYLEENDTWVLMTEEKMRAAGWDVTALNAGISGSGINNQIKLLTEIVDRAKPKIVILAFYLDDATSCCTLPSPKFKGLPKNSVLADHAMRTFYTVAEIYQKYPEDWKEEEISLAFNDFGKNFAKKEGMLYEKAKTDFRYWGNSFSDTSWQYITPRIEQLTSMAKTKEFKLGIVIFPVSYQVLSPHLEDFPQRQMLSLANARGIPALDLLPKLRSLEIEPINIFHDHCHPTKAANHHIAGWMNNFITSNFSDTVRKQLH